MYGSPEYQINTATLGLYAEYPLFETRCHRLQIRPTLVYGGDPQHRGDFGFAWRLNYAARLHLDPQAGIVRLTKGSGQTADFALQPGMPGKEGRRLSQLTGIPLPLIEYPDRFTFLDETHGASYAFTKYGGDNLPHIIFDEYNNGLALKYDAQGSLVAMQDSAGRRMLLSHNAPGLCGAFELNDGRACRMEYDPQGYLACIWNFAETPTRFAYENGQLTQIIHGKTPRTTTFHYDNARQIAAVTNPNGGVTRYRREGNRVHVTTPAGRTRVYTSENGVTTAMADAAGETRYFYQNGKRVAEVDKNGHRTEWAYDEKGNLLGERLPSGAQTRYSYDESGHLLSQTDPEGGTLRFTNDARGDIVRLDYPDGSSASIAYTANGMPARSTLPGGRVLEQEYDRFGNLIAEKDALGTIASYRYDACGYECVGITDGMGRETVLAHDELGRISETAKPDGVKEYFRYNCCAMVEYIDGAVKRWYTERDPMARATKRIDPEGGIFATLFDADGIPVAEMDENGAQRTSAWDAAGFCTARQDPLGGTVGYSFDATGSLLTLTDERGNLNRIARAPGGAATQVMTAHGRREEWGYDRSGRVVMNKKPSGAQTTYEYDVMGRLRTLNIGPDRFSFTHDAAGNTVTRGTPLGEYRVAYDARDRMMGSSSPDGAVFAYAYNNDDSLAALRYPDGVEAVYEYDACGRLAGTGFASASVSFTFDATDNLVSERCANGVKLSYTYDACAQMTGMRVVDKDGTLLCAASWRYDAAGNLIHEDMELALLAEADALPATGFSAAYDADNQISTLDGTACSKDMDGNLSAAGDLDCKYSADGMLVSVQTSAGGAVCAYGADLRPAEVRRGTFLEKRYYDGAGRMLCRNIGNIKQQFLWAGGIVVGAVFGDKTLYYHRDRRGNIILITDETGSPVCAYAYRPYGEIRAKVERIIGNPFTFMGAFGVTDEGDDLYLTGYRAYFAKLGRFLQPDPLWFADNAGRYIYAKNNPLRYIDPVGDAAGAIILVGLGLIGAGKFAWDFGQSLYKGTSSEKKADELIIPIWNARANLTKYDPKKHSSSKKVTIDGKAYVKDGYYDKYQKLIEQRDGHRQAANQHKTDAACTAAKQVVTGGVEKKLSKFGQAGEALGKMLGLL